MTDTIIWYVITAGIGVLGLAIGCSIGAKNVKWTIAELLRGAATEPMDTDTRAAFNRIYNSLRNILRDI